MHTIAIASAVTLLCVGAALAQAPTLDAGAGTFGGRLDDVTAVRIRPGLTAAERDTIAARMAAYRDHLLAEAPRADELARAGLAAEIDAVQQASAAAPGQLVPIHVGVLTPVPATPSVQVDPVPTRPGVPLDPTPTRPTVQVDPALTAAAHDKLQARLGRAPTAAELDAEIAAFDRRIAEMNRALAERRPELARATRTDGQFQPGLEAQVLGLSAPSPATLRENDAVGLQILIRALLLDQPAAPPRR